LEPSKLHLWKKSKKIEPIQRIDETIPLWLLSEPELPIVRNLARIQLARAESLSSEELDGIPASYERQLSDQAIMCRETIRRASLARSGIGSPERSEREILIWSSIDENHTAFFENELAWTRSLRAKLKELR
jgi:hypothetical protein